MNLYKILKLISLRRIKSVAKNVMLMAGVVYVMGHNPISNFNHFIEDPEERSWLLLQAILIYGTLYFIFYLALKLVLRYFFHSKLRELVRIERDEFLRNPTFKDKKNLYLMSSQTSSIIYRYFVKMGLITTSDINTPMQINSSDKEDLFNEILEDQYSWILIIFHSLITTIVAFNFYTWWFILIMILAILIMLLVVFVTVFFLMNLEYLEIVRKQLLKKSITLM